MTEEDAAGRMELLKDSWQKAFSDPRQYQPKNFCYLVTSVVPEEDLWNLFIKVTAIKSGNRREDQEIDLYEHPELVGMRGRISATAIDPRHSGTFRLCGLIIKAPFENVLSMSPKDIGRIGRDKGEAKPIENRELLTIGELLRKQDRTVAISNYNEIELAGENSELLGFFVKYNDEGECMASEDEVIHWENLAAKLGVPVVYIRAHFEEQFDYAGPTYRPSWWGKK